MRAERVTLSEREQRRAMALNRVLAGAWTRREAAAVLGLSERQVRRLLAAYAACGPQALAHGNRGRPPAGSARATPGASDTEAPPPENRHRAAGAPVVPPPAPS
jgi:hypothetical protein